MKISIEELLGKNEFFACFLVRSLWKFLLNGKLRRLKMIYLGRWLKRVSLKASVRNMPFQTEAQIGFLEGIGHQCILEGSEPAMQDPQSIRHELQLQEVRKGTKHWIPSTKLKGFYCYSYN